MSCRFHRTPDRCGADDRDSNPRAQIDAARQATGKKLVYMPHIGARQRERALAAMEKSQAKA